MRKVNQMTRTLTARIIVLLFVIVFSNVRSYGQANLPVYTDHLVNGFQNWSWATVNMANSLPLVTMTNASAKINIANTSPVHSGNYSVSVTDGPNYQALYLEHAVFNTSPYSSLDFWINGGSSGGQRLQAGGLLDGTNQIDYPLPALQANTWQHVTIPLSSLGVGNAPNFSGFWIQSSVNTAQPVFYVDDIQLLAAPAPAPVHLGVNATSVIRTADTRWFGLNTAVWDYNFNTASTSDELKKIGCTTLRFPGGSLADEYHWAVGSSGTRKSTWGTSFVDFMQIATNLGATVFITVNYGTGTSNEAAAWVASANITNHCNFKYWEIGNEVYGKWEADSNSLPHDPVTYATRAAGYIQLMKAKDPTVKIGVVAVPGEDANTNYIADGVTNPVTGQAHFGWTPVMLATFKKLGVYPDFLIYHYYPEYTGDGSNLGDSDPLLLQAAGNACPRTFGDWAGAASNLRNQISDYIGSPGTNIELCVTENNSDSGAQGRQSTGIVNALYMADSLGELMKTEFNSLIWWDLRNGPDRKGDFGPSLYGWRTHGDYGIMGGTTTLYPTSYAMKLLQSFVRGGDSVLDASSDYLLLSDYAVRRTNGSLTLLVINKDLAANITGQIILDNFLTAANASVQTYGIAQDEAMRTNAAAPLRDVAVANFPNASSNFTYSFPPGSMTLFTFTPAAPGSRTSALTNMSSSPPSSATNLISGNDQFWRATWHH
jgi:alpha-L-arabinofuranosidase